jgi:outer membrane receptor protein involved in Fe transport
MAMLVVAVAGVWPLGAWSQIEEIVVTTRKKEERLQDVPIAVSAISEEQISRQGVADLDDVVRNTPSVQFDRSFGPSDTRITIRGLSNTRGRSNVAFLVDGVDVTTENLIVAGSGLLANRRLLSDVQRIEIVKGPQSALYGRAAFAGAINYITKEPGDFFEGSAKVDFADDGFQQVEAGIGGPVIDDLLGMRLTGFWFTQDGHYVNQMSGENVGGAGGSGAALTTVVRPNEFTKIKLRAEYSQEDFDPLPNVRIGGGWQNAESVRLYEYPDAILQHARNQLNGLVSLGSALGYNPSTAGNTGLLDFNQYCPEALKDPSKGPGFCLPRHYGSAGGRVVKHSENPLTNQDFDGTDLESFRLSMIAEFDLDGGALTSYTGWTNFDARDNYDQDWQAEGADYEYPWGPPTGSSDGYLGVPSTGNRQADQLLSQQIADTTSEVEQFSQELRFASRLDGPLQYTVGALFWDEVRQLNERNTIMACLPMRKQGALGLDGDDFTYPTFTYTSGICDGRNTPFAPNLPTVNGWQALYQQLQPFPEFYWRAETRHWSFYGKLEWELAEDWTVEFEDRFVSESFRLNKPNKPGCTNLGSSSVNSAFLLETGGVNVECEAVTVSTEGSVLISNQDYRYLQASTSSHFNTPKVTLNWKVTPDSLVYAFWARAQKPGGINQLTGGGTASFASEESFDPEKLESWELGTKNKLDFFGTLFLNASGFFQDYTDKQVSTQRLDESGSLRPIVLNASGAEIWGGELDITWRPYFLEGLALSAAYTYLDAQYTEYTDDLTSVQRAANIGNCTLIYKGKDANRFNVEGSLDELNAMGATINAVACRVDLSGNQLERTPEHALALGASYVRPLLDTGLDLLLEANASWQDKRYLDQDNTIYFESYWNVDARVGLSHPKYEIIAYVDNLFDDDTLKSGGSGPDFGRQPSELGFTAGLGVSQYFGTLPDPRIFGIRATYRFGDE